MRYTALGLGLMLCLIASDNGSAQSTSQSSMLWAASSSSYRVTVSQNGVVTTSMLVPTESIVVASFRNEDGMRELSPGRSEFRGPVTLSILPRVTMPEGNQWLINLREIMSDPPLSLTVSNAEVLVERTEP